MSPDRGGSQEEARIRRTDARKIPVRAPRPEKRQHGYPGATRATDVERAERAGLAELIAVQPGPIGPRRRELDKNVKVYRQAAHLYVGVQEYLAEMGAGSLDEPDRLDAEEEVIQRVIEADPVLRDAGTDALQAYARLGAVEDALRRHHPDLNQKDRGERIKLLIRGAEHFDGAWEALLAFEEFAQAGRAAGLATQKVDDPQKDMRAAELKYALDFSHREIGEILGVPQTEKEAHEHGGNRRVGHMVDSGRKLFENDPGKDGFWTHIEAARPGLHRWYALSDRQRVVLRLIRLTAGLTDRSMDEVGQELRPAIERLVEKRSPKD